MEPEIFIPDMFDREGKSLNVNKTLNALSFQCLEDEAIFLDMDGVEKLAAFLNYWLQAGLADTP